MVKTSIKKEAGTEATWNERFRIMPIDPTSNFTFTALSSNFMSDQLLGASKMFNIDDLSNGKYEQEINLLDKKGLVVGSVKV